MASENEPAHNIRTGNDLVDGIFFLHFRILSAIMLYNASLVVGVTNAMVPWLRGKLNNGEPTHQMSGLEEPAGSLNTTPTSRQKPSWTVISEGICSGGFRTHQTTIPSRSTDGGRAK
jgi:hypothetical protein